MSKEQHASGRISRQEIYKVIVKLQEFKKREFKTVQDFCKFLNKTLSRKDVSIATARDVAKDLEVTIVFSGKGGGNAPKYALAQLVAVQLTEVMKELGIEPEPWWGLIQAGAHNAEIGAEIHRIREAQAQGQQARENGMLSAIHNGEQDPALLNEQPSAL